MESTSGASWDRRADEPGEPAGDVPSPRPVARPRSRMRALYFAASAFWGFVAGSAAVVGCLQIVGRPLPLTVGILGTLGGAAVVAIVGGVVLSRAYREAAHRRHR